MVYFEDISNDNIAVWGNILKKMWERFGGKKIMFGQACLWDAHERWGEPPMRWFHGTEWRRAVRNEGYSSDHDGHMECLLFQKNMQNEQTRAEFLRRDRKGQRRTQYGSVEKPKAPGSPGLRDGPFQVLPSTPRKDSTQTQATATVSMTLYSHSQQVDKNILSRGWRDFSVAKITLLRPSLLRVCFGCLSHYGFWSFFHLH